MVVALEQEIAELRRERTAVTNANSAATAEESATPQAESAATTTTAAASSSSLIECNRTLNVVLAERDFFDRQLQRQQNESSQHRHRSSTIRNLIDQCNAQLSTIATLQPRLMKLVERAAAAANQTTTIDDEKTLQDNLASKHAVSSEQQQKLIYITSVGAATALIDNQTSWLLNWYRNLQQSRIDSGLLLLFILLRN